MVRYLKICKECVILRSKLRKHVLITALEQFVNMIIKYLFFSKQREDYWYVPGGRVKMLENSEDALKRERKR